MGPSITEQQDHNKEAKPTEEASKQALHLLSANQAITGKHGSEFRAGIIKDCAVTITVIKPKKAKIPPPPSFTSETFYH